MTTTISILLPVLLGAIGWVVLEFFGRPVRNFFDLRRDAKRLMMVHWKAPNVMLPFDDGLLSDRKDKWEDARSDFTDTGARLVSFDAAESLAAWFVRLMGFNPKRAGAALLVIANELGSSSKDFNKNLATVERALKFKDE